jgi:hypothetical protein
VTGGTREGAPPGSGTTQVPERGAQPGTVAFPWIFERKQFREAARRRMSIRVRAVGIVRVAITGSQGEVCRQTRSSPLAGDVLEEWRLFSAGARHCLKAGRRESRRRPRVREGTG